MATTPLSAVWTSLGPPARLLLLACGLAACSDGQPAADARRDVRPPDLYLYLQDRTPDLPPALVDGPAPRVAPFLLDFESDSGNLVATRDWEWGHLAFVRGPGCEASAAPPAAGHSGTGMWGTVLNDCHHGLGNATDPCKNLTIADDSILTLRLALPATLKTATLTFWEWTDFFLPFDWNEIRVDGKVFRQTCSGNYLRPTVWAKQSLDLSAHVGKTITVSFHFMASSVVNLAGWYIDDLEVSGM
jgi:hypothetical protein